MHPAKRRRVDNATSTLAKPFRSPLHVDPNKQKASSEKQNDISSQATLSTKCTESLRPAVVALVPSATATTVGPTSRTKTIAELRGNWPPAQSSPSRALPDDDESVVLQKRHKVLTLQLRDLSQSLDVATQALKLVQSNQDDDLGHLIRKWQVASRDAAEELFSAAKYRVDGMGGVRIWRERYMRPPDEQLPWCNENDDANQPELTEEQREQLEIERDEAKVESEKYGLTVDQSAPGMTDDDSFTLAMMLKQLNVDLEVIGYDAQAQGWVD